jgi:hypothetical protein
MLLGRLRVGIAAAVALPEDPVWMLVRVDVALRAERITPAVAL